MSDIVLLRYQSSNEKAEVEKGDAKDKVSQEKNATWQIYFSKMAGNIIRV